MPCGFPTTLPAVGPGSGRAKPTRVRSRAGDTIVVHPSAGYSSSIKRQNSMEVATGQTRSSLRSAPGSSSAEIAGTGRAQRSGKKGRRIAPNRAGARAWSSLSVVALPPPRPPICLLHAHAPAHFLALLFSSLASTTRDSPKKRVHVSRSRPSDSEASADGYNWRTQVAMTSAGVGSTHANFGAAPNPSFHALPSLPLTLVSRPASRTRAPRVPSPQIRL